MNVRSSYRVVEFQADRDVDDSMSGTVIETVCRSSCKYPPAILAHPNDCMKLLIDLGPPNTRRSTPRQDCLRPQASCLKTFKSDAPIQTKII